MSKLTDAIQKKAAAVMPATAPAPAPVQGAPAPDLLSMTPADIQKTSGGGFGYLDALLNHLDNLKGQVSAGQLNLVDYLNKSKQFAKEATNTLNLLTTTGSNNATAAKARLSKLRDYADLTSPSGQGDFKGAKIPFDRQEIAQLPSNVIPSTDDLAKANIPVDMFPPGTPFRTPAAPTRPVVTPQPATPPPQVTPPLPSNPQPGAPQPIPNAPITSIPDPQNPGSIINVPIVGDPLRDTVSKVPDQQTIEQEAARQAEQMRQALAAQDAIRSQRLNDLQGVLAQNADRQFAYDQPGIYEDLNSRGLLRSSGLGDALAREKAKLVGDMSTQLQTQGLADRDAQVQGISNILANTTNYQNLGLERRFSLDDYNREVQNAQLLGSQVAPQIRTGSGQSGGVLSGALTGAAGLSALGPYGAAAGAIGGGLLGAKKGGGK